LPGGMTDDPELTAPPLVLQAAQEHALGTLVAVRKDTNPFVAAAVALVVGGLCYGLIELLTRNTEDLNLPRAAEKAIGFFGLFVCVFIVGAVIFAAVSLIRGSRSYYVWSDGFLFLHNKKARALHWPEITELRGNRYTSGDKAGKIMDYSLVPADGKEIRVPLEVDDDRDPFIDALIARLTEQGRPVV